MEQKNYKFQDVCEIVTDYVANGSFKSLADNVQYSDKKDYARLIRLVDFNNNYDEKNAVWVPESSYNFLKKSVLYGNEVIISNVGANLGTVFKCPKLTYPMTLGPNSLLVRTNYLCNQNYLYYYLKSKIGYSKLMALVSGSAMPKFNKTELRNMEISLPDRAYQDKAVEVLIKIDKKIELNNKINNNLYDLDKSYFEDFISNCDREVAIKDIANEVLDYTKNKNDKVKLLNSSDVTENIFPKVEFVDNKDLKGHFKKRFKKHDILYSQIRPRNHHYGYVLLDDSENYLASTRFMVVRNKKEKVSSSLLYYYLTSKNAVEDFTTKTELRSGTFPQGNYEDLSSYVVKYSSNQESITKILDLILETINNNNNENEKLSQLRDTLLPKLMNGEIDLDNIEI